MSIEVGLLLHSWNTVVGNQAHIPRGVSQYVQPLASLCWGPIKSPLNSFFGGLVDARLRAYANCWDSITADVFVRNVIRNGYALLVTEGGPPHLSRFHLAFNPPVDVKARLDLEEALTNLLQKSVIETVVDLRLPGFQIWLFLVPTRDGGNSPVIDLFYISMSFSR